MRTSALIAAFATLIAAAPAWSQTPPAAAPGETIFKQRCQLCHSDVASKPSILGPNLSGVVGRKAASLTFNYSPALKASGLVWTRANLDKFLAAPAKLVPGTRMVVSLPDATQRAALVVYLAKRGHGQFWYNAAAATQPPHGEEAT